MMQVTNEQPMSLPPSPRLGPERKRRHQLLGFFAA